jgi:hypothetical protein
MLLDSYQEKGFLFNTNMKEAATTPGIVAYRGDLVLKEGEVADAMGRRKPPIAVIKEVVVLIRNDKIRFISGFLDEFEHLSVFSEKYQADFAEDMFALFFVPNIADSMQVKLGGVNYVLISLTDGMVWNETMEELKLEKSDFKGQSPADKVVTLCEGTKDYRPKYPSFSYEEALAKTTQTRRESRGPV